MMFKDKQRERYDLVWSFPEYRARSTEEQLIPEVLTHFNVSAEHSVISIGCGSGRGLASLKRHRHCYVTGVDLSRYSLDRDVDLDLFVVADAASGRVCDKILHHDFGLCIDMLEHMPEAGVFMVLKNLKRLARRAFIQVHTEPEQLGRMLCGVQLHLTVKPTEWWCDALRAVYGKGVRRLRAGCFVVG